MGIDGRVASGAGEILVFPVGDVKVRLGISELLRQSEVDDVDLVPTLADAHQEVIGLYVPVDEVAGVNVLDARDLMPSVSRENGTIERYAHQLVREEKDRLQAEFAVTKVEEVLERGSKEVKDHGIVVALGAIPPDKGNAHATCEGLVHLGLVFKLGMLGFDGLELDGNFFAGNNINSQVDIT